MSKLEKAMSIILHIKGNIPMEEKYSDIAFWGLVIKSISTTIK